MISALNHGIYGYAPVRKSGVIFAKSNLKSKTNSRDVFVLNKAYKPKVLEFISDLTKNINSSRQATLSILETFEAVEKNSEYKSEKITKEKLLVQEEKLVDALNGFVENTLNENDVPAIENYMENTNKVFEENKEDLSMIGLSKNNDKFIFDKSKIEKISINELKENYEKYNDIFTKLNYSTNELSTKAVSEHINFKDFSYYFNYGINLYKNNSLELLGTGTIVNLKL